MRNRYSSKKKLGVLVSSLALAAVTAMAGVTGTAAWFTATRSATATASTFTAKAPGNTLTIKATALQGTYSNGKDSNVYVTNGADGPENYLRDASFDATTGTLYKAFVNDSGEATSYEAVKDYDSTATMKDPSGKVHKIFYAVSWTYTISYTNPGSNGSALFFDPTATASNFGSNTDGVAPGFRIAFNFEENSGKRYLVWANDAVKTYVNGTEKASIDDDHFVQSDTTYPRQADGISAETAAKEKTYLGTFKKTKTDDTEDKVNDITVTCTAWYEGTDEAVKTDNLNASEAITATMTFYTRDLAAKA